MTTPSFVTQVRRPDEEEESEYDGGITGTIEEVEEEPKVSLLQKLFCCFFAGVQNSIPLSNIDNSSHLLPPQLKSDKGKVCLILDLDETLIHSSFKPVQSDFMVNVEIEGSMHRVFVLKRPGVDEFLLSLSAHFEIVVFTASIPLYGNPVMDLLDVNKTIKHRLFREDCTFHRGNYIKDLSRIGRPLSQTLIIDNSPTSFFLHPDYAIEIRTWFDDKNDKELYELLPFLINDVSKCKDVRVPLKKWRERNNIA